MLAWLPADVRADATDDYNVAVQFYKQERWDVAARSFRAFLKQNGAHPLAPEARLYLGQALVQQRKFQEARDVFREYVKLNADAPDLPLARFRVAECSYFLQENRAALPELEQFLEQHAQHELAPRARLYRGQTQLRLNDAAGAEQTLAALVEQKPEPALLGEAQYSLARAREVLSKNAEAIAGYEQLAATKEIPFAAEAQFRLATMAFNAQDWARAAERFVAVARDFPQHRLAVTATLNAGYAEYYQKHFPEAIAHFSKAAADPQQAPLAEMWIGLTHKEAGEWDQAIAAFKTRYEKDDKQPLAEKLLFHWADCELRRGQYAEARKLFVSVADRWPDGERGDDSLHLATEAALRAPDLTDAEQLNQRVEKQYATSSLRWRQQVLAGRIALARGDAIRAANASDPAAAKSYQQAVERLSRVVTESELPATQFASRLQLARALERLGESARVIETLPVVEAIRSGQGSVEIVDGLLLRTRSILAANLPRRRQSRSSIWISRSRRMPRPPGRSCRQKSILAMRRVRQRHLDQLTKSDTSGLSGGRRIRRGRGGVFRQGVGVGDDVCAGCGVRRSRRDKVAALSGWATPVTRRDSTRRPPRRLRNCWALTTDDRRPTSNAAYMRGLSLQLADRRDDAIAAFQDGLEKSRLRRERRQRPTRLSRCRMLTAAASAVARLLREAGQVEEADAAYAAAYKTLTALPMEQQTELDKLVNEWALLSYENQRFERSDELFKLLIEKRPDSDLADDARLYLAESQFFAEKLDEAAAAFSARGRSPKRTISSNAGPPCCCWTSRPTVRIGTNSSRTRIDFERFRQRTERGYARYRAGEPRCN
ncbi:MAG: tetratricopeptide repeat protein [Planctomycetaceae bacterium]